MFPVKQFSPTILILILVLSVTTCASQLPVLSVSSEFAANLDPSPPTSTVKLIFIHHSTGENWLRDDYGRLGLALMDNNYYVSDTNYGWGPNSIGDRTDIPDWPEWFSSAKTSTYLNALFQEYGQNSAYTRQATDPGGENEIVMFKSCFPNSNLEGNPNDPPDPKGWLTVGHAKWVYNKILDTFQAHPEKLFVIITAPPVTDPTYAANARAFNNWLMDSWLQENHYSLGNVAVFDFYNVLTDRDAHHMYNSTNGRVIHTIVAGHNTSYYPSGGGDDHPNKAGSRKATKEFLPLLNIFYHRWQVGAQTKRATFRSTSNYDGWVLESQETSNKGRTRNSRATTFRLGDNNQDQQYRGILSFNTASLPDNAVISKVTLMIRKQGLVGSNPFTSHGNILLDIRKGAFSGTNTLQSSDFQAAASMNRVGVIRNSSPLVSWYRVVLRDIAFRSINKRGLTQLRLRFATDDNDDMSADFLRFFSGNASPVFRPKLIVEYSLP